MRPAVFWTCVLLRKLSFLKLEESPWPAPCTLQRWGGVQMGTRGWGRHLLGLQALSRWEGKLVGVCDALTQHSDPGHSEARAGAL